MKLIFNTIILICFSTILFAQDYKADLKKVTELYQKMDKYSTEVHVTTFESLKDKKPSFYQKTIIKKDGNKFYYQFRNNIMMVNKKYSIVVDKQRKTIIYKALEKNAEPDMGKLTSFDQLEKVMDNYKKVEYKGIKNGVKHYIIYPKYNLEKAELFMQPNGLITKIIYQYANTNNGSKRMVAIFKNSTLKPVYSKSQFSAAQFFVKKGKKFKPSPKYSTFKLIEVKNQNF